MKILLLGKDGQVGWELQRSLAVLGSVVAYGRDEANFEDLDVLRQCVHSVAPNVIVNAAAYTAVDRAESESVRARMTNTQAVAVLADEAKRNDAWLIHYSTDYVFDGSNTRSYREDDLTKPLNIYGQTKLDGEKAICASNCRHLIFRTSWVYAVRGSNFVKSILRLAKTRRELKIVADQFGAPTAAELIADVTAMCLMRLQCDPALAMKASGIYHLTAQGETSWYHYAQFILDEAERLGGTLLTKSGDIVPIPASDYPTAAIRPANSRLDTAKLSSTFNLLLPTWQFHTKRMLRELYSEEKL